MLRLKPNYLFWAMAIPEVIDVALTFLGQNRGYWTNPGLVDEGSPAWHLLALNPIYFALFTLFWLIFFYLFISKIKSPWNLMIVLSFIIAHSWGAASWISKLVFASPLSLQNTRIYWYFDIAYFIFISLITGFLITKHFNTKRV